MEEKNLAVMLGALDECIEKYSEDRKNRVDDFIHRHFSIRETLEIQKKTFSIDILFNPLNALWSIPYLTLKKSVETLDKLGWTNLTPAMDKIPSGLKTGYQKEIEKLITCELLDYNLLVLELRKHPALRELCLNENAIKAEFKKEIEKYSSNQSLITDLSGSVMTVLTGWLFFGDKSLGIFGMGDRIARKMAHDKAASGFVFGEKLGSAFYNVFPVVPSKIQAYTFTAGIGATLTVLSVLMAVLSDPLRKNLGLHKKNLDDLIKNLEEKLFLRLKKEIKSSIRKSSSQLSA